VDEWVEGMGMGEGKGLPGIDVHRHRISIYIPDTFCTTAHVVLNSVWLTGNLLLSINHLSFY